jgi:hypothetical protein
VKGQMRAAQENPAIKLEHLTSCKAAVICGTLASCHVAPASCPLGFTSPPRP